MSIIPLPSITFKLTAPSSSQVDFSNNLAWGGSSAPTITQNFGRQGDTAVFVVVDDFAGRTTPNFVIKPLSQVAFFDHTANVSLFAGVVTNVQLNAGVNRNEWILNCTDYTFYADNAIVQGTFIGKTIDQIAVALTQQANCGVNAIQTGQTTAGQPGFVTPAPLLQSFVLNYSTLSDAWRKLAKLASLVTPYGWYVDENRNFHFYDQTTALSSGVTFTTTLGYVASSTPNLTEGHMQFENSFSFEWDGASVRNKILVQGATQIIKYGNFRKDPPTDTFTGGASAFPMRYTVSGTPVVTLNGTNQSVAVVQAGGSFTPAPGVTTPTWIVAQNAIGAWFLNAPVGHVPGGGTIKIWYDYQVPIVAQANDFASQSLYTGPNGGVFSEYISDTSLTTVPMAQAIAFRQKQEYGFVVDRITFTSSPEWMGWVRAGQTFKMTNSLVPDDRNNYAWGLTNATFIVIGNSIQFMEGGYRTCNIKAVRI